MGKRVLWLAVKTGPSQEMILELCWHVTHDVGREDIRSRGAERGGGF